MKRKANLMPGSAEQKRLAEEKLFVKAMGDLEKAIEGAKQEPVKSQEEEDVEVLQEALARFAPEIYDETIGRAPSCAASPGFSAESGRNQSCKRPRFSYEQDPNIPALMLPKPAKEVAQHSTEPPAKPQSKTVRFVGV